MKKSILFFIVLMAAVSLHAQISVQHKGTLKELFAVLTNRYGYNFMYSNNDINDQQKININVKNVNLNTVLNEVSKTVNITYQVKNKQVIIKKGGKPKETEKEKPVTAITEKESQKPPYKDSTELQEVISLKIPEKVNDTINITKEVIKDTIPLITEQKDTEQLVVEIKQTETANDIAQKNNDTTKNNKPEVPAKPIKYRNYEFRISTNLLYDIALTPNLNIEFKPNKNFGILAGGMWTHINWGNGDKSYRIWAVNPEVRYYLPDNSFYFGAMFHIGELNFKLSKTGYQGNIIGGGLTTGYLLQLNNRFSFDFGIGLGCTHFNYDEYEYVNRVNVRTGSDIKNLWGLTKASVTLTFKLN